MRIILPMAGHGRRFAEAGYATDKPLIEVNGKTLLEWALDPIPKTWNRTFIIRQDQPAFELQKVAWRIDHETDSWLALPGSTRGAAMTVLTAALALPPEDPIACMNCDQWFQLDLEAVVAEAMREEWDGFILTFDGSGPQWSYAVCSPARPGKVVAVVEKPPKPIPNSEATVGFYWWRQARDLVRSVCSMIAEQQTVNGEYYLAPSYNNLLRWGTADVRAVMVKEFVGLGTPEQVRSFEQAALVREP